MKTMAASYGIQVEDMELVSWMQWMEITLTQSACGIMDQYVVVIGNENYFAPMLFQPCKPYPLAKLLENLQVWSIDSDVCHASLGIEYETAYAVTFMGYRYLCNWKNPDPFLEKNEHCCVG